MESRPDEITHEDYECGLDIQGIAWGEGGIPPKDDFREKRHNHDSEITNFQSKRLWITNSKTTSSSTSKEPRSPPTPPNLTFS